ncbi:MFS transporter [Siccirubricoccus sp. G192]|uniref:MFS transporter n=1 Tax=Siccirubricoccus sp. G192 TaxID=2849651 RepID=UPI001C2B8DA5|nr:MFS transporter [Siccirubricoccus sp. G192]MBV1798581.1 MFS transporter [Siccirubricoccus sp. G192]
MTRSADAPIPPSRLHGAAGGLAAALAATTGAQALATLTVFVLPVLAPLAARDLGAAPHWVGYQVAAVYVAASTTSALSAGALRRWGPARCTQIALAAAGIACLLMALAGLPGALLGSLLTGLGYGLTNPAASQVLSRLAPPARRNMVFAVKQTGVPIGAALAGLLLPSLALLAGWRVAVLGIAVLLLLAALGAGIFRAAWDAERDPRYPLRLGAGGGLAALRDRPGLRGLAAVSALFSGFQLALGAYTVTMLVEEFGWSPVAAGAVAAVSQGIGAVARLGWGLVADWWRSGLRALAAIGLITTLGALALPFALAWPGAAVIGLFCLLGGSAAGWNGVLMAEAARMAAPGKVGDAAGGVLAVAFAGVVVGPSILALVVGAVGSYALAFGLLALLPLAGMVIAWRTARWA